MSVQDEAESTDFDSECLKEQTRFHCCYPWFIPIDSIRDYFGEKIALYFEFLSFYTFHLSYMAFIGFIIQLLQDNLQKKDASIINIIYSIFIVVWSTCLLQGWKRKESFFAFRFGQIGIEDDETDRPAFQGTFIRSMITDQVNEEYYPESVRKMKMFFSFFISMVIIICVIVVVILLFLFRMFLRQNQIMEGVPLLNPDALPSILNTIQIMVFNAIYEHLNDKFTNYENHKMASTYENSLIAKVFLFTWFNTFNSCFIIAFLDSYFSGLDLCVYQKGEPANCFLMLRSQITTIFVINFIKNIPEMITPLIKA